MSLAEMDVGRASVSGSNTKAATTPRREDVTGKIPKGFHQSAQRCHDAGAATLGERI